MRCLIICLACLAVPAAAQELNQRQQAAFDAILPALADSLVEQGGDALGAMAPMLASCMVSEARRRELNALGDGALDDTDTALMNDIMARPAVQGCVAKAAGQG